MAKLISDIQDMTLAGLNLISQALSIYDSDLRLVTANLRFRKIFDLPSELVQSGAPFDQTIRHLVQRGEYGEITDTEAFIAERITQAKAFTPHYFERTRANGTTISVEGSPLRRGGWVTVYTDITEIKQQEALLRNRSANLSEELISRSEELSKINRALTATVTALEEAKHDLTTSQDRLNLVNAMTPAHIARVDRSGEYTYSNRKLSAIIPGRSSDIIGKHFREALGEDVYNHFAPAFEKALRGEAPVIEFEHKVSGRHIRLAFTPDADEEGAMTGAYLLSTDVTDEVNARHALTHARRRELAAQLTSGLAHDFSNLLTIILGQQSRLNAIADLPPQISKISATIKSAALRGGALLEGLSQVDAQRALDIRPVDFPEFIHSTILLAQAALRDDITLSLNNEISETHLMLDPGFAQDALLNLVLNSVEAMNGPGRISITIVQLNPEFLVISVRDTGPGFTENALQNALAPFFTSKKGKPGRGLGLSTAFDFAKLSGGKIRISNHAEGGAIVALHIPYQPSKPVSPGIVLLVEDNLDIRETIRGHLRQMGHSVIEADNVVEAARLAKMPDITHCITDIRLGDGPTGFDLAQELRQTRPEIPVLIITGLPSNDPLRVNAAQSFEILQKPFGFSRLSRKMQKVTAS